MWSAGDDVETRSGVDSVLYLFIVFKLNWDGREELRDKVRTRKGAECVECLAKGCKALLFW